MNKKIEEYQLKEKALREFSEEIKSLVKDIFDALSVEQKENLKQLANFSKSSKPLIQISKQALEFHKNGEYEKALPLLIEAAEHGSGSSCYLVGNYFYEGKGVEVNYSTAYDYYQLGVNLGNNDCRYKIGYMKYFAIGTVRDIDGGLEDMENAALLDSVDAISTLIDIYERGQFVDIDYEVADYWRERIEGIGEA